MIRTPRLALIAYALAVVVVVGDQALKYWVLEVFRLPELGSAAFLGGPIKLTMVWNSGTSFGFLGSLTKTEAARKILALVLSAFSLTVAAALCVYAWRLQNKVLALAIGLIIGGAVGNAIDRLHAPQAVVDFIDVRDIFSWFPWVFNLADSAISVGSVLLIWDLFLAPRKRAPT